jgi:hypothetical protein
MYDPQLSHIISTAITHLQTDMALAAPTLAENVSHWIQHLAGTQQPANYFQHPLAFPSLLLPWWLEKTLQDAPEVAFQANLVTSTINGYYYIRLIDNLLDGNATVELQLLPALNFFHSQFQTTYQLYFAHDHPFWDFFAATWLHSAEVTFKDAYLNDIDEAQFQQVAAQKTCAVKIPLAAVCYHYQRPDLIEPWSRFVDTFGCWHQLLNDVFDWQRDETRHTRTYFLCEAERRRKSGESVSGWVVREGFGWGIDKLDGWMSALQMQAGQLRSPELGDYLDTRQAMLDEQANKVKAGLQSLAKIVT